MAPTPIRTLRIDDDIWAAAMSRAQAEGENITALMRDWLTDYAAGRKRVGPDRPGTVEVSRAELAKLRALIDKILQ